MAKKEKKPYSLKHGRYITPRTLLYQPKLEAFHFLFQLPGLSAAPYVFVNLELRELKNGCVPLKVFEAKLAAVARSLADTLIHLEGGEEFIKNLRKLRGGRK